MFANIAVIFLSMCTLNRPLDAASPCKFFGACPKISSLEDRCSYLVYVPTTFKSRNLQMDVGKTVGILSRGVKYNTDEANVQAILWNKCSVYNQHQW